jgi:hypothetical protein
MRSASELPKKASTDRARMMKGIAACASTSISTARSASPRIWAARRPSVAPIRKPSAADRPGENVGNSVSRLYYNASTMICVPTSLAQEVGEALGAQAGQAKLTEVLSEAGFTRVRRATEGPFNMVLEARP